MRPRTMIIYCCCMVLAAAGLRPGLFGDTPPGWCQVNYSGFGQDATHLGTYLFVFDDAVYAINEQGWFRMENPMRRVWTPMVPPGPPAGPGAMPDGSAPFGDFLYAWSAGRLWYVAKGTDPNGPNWIPVLSTGPPGGVSPRPMTMFNAQLYGIYDDGSSGTFEIWRTSAVGKSTASWEQVVANSFGDPVNNKAVSLMMVFNDHIYAGTTTYQGTFGDPRSYGSGVEVWESSNGDRGAWVQVNEDGFGTKSDGCAGSNRPCFLIHQLIGSGAVYRAANQSREYLYIGTKSHFGAEIFRYDGTGVEGWTNVTPDWLNRHEPGVFGTVGPSRAEAMAVFDGALFMAEGFPTGNLAKYDGAKWSKVVEGPTPFALQNGGLRSVVTFKGKLFTSTLHYAGSTSGDQIWGYPFPLRVLRFPHMYELCQVVGCPPFRTPWEWEVDPAPSERFRMIVREGGAKASALQTIRRQAVSLTLQMAVASPKQAAGIEQRAKRLLETMREIEGAPQRRK
jgi:hypothetical protein